MQHAMHCADYYKHLHDIARDSEWWIPGYEQYLRDCLDIAYEYLLASCEQVRID